MVIGRRRRVRVHVKGSRVSFEGFQKGRRRVAGHYILHLAKMLEEGGGEVMLDGLTEIPAENVFMVQALK